MCLTLLKKFQIQSSNISPATSKDLAFSLMIKNHEFYPHKNSILKSISKFISINDVMHSKIK